jgi:hypothetical protein
MNCVPAADRYPILDYRRTGRRIEPHAVHGTARR